MKNLYLILAILGAVVPYIFFIAHFNEFGFGLGAFVQGLFANGAAGGFSADLLITSLVFWIYLWNRKTPKIWGYIIVNLVIGLSCALPAYLYFNAKPKQKG